MCNSDGSVSVCQLIRLQLWREWPAYWEDNRLFQAGYYYNESIFMGMTVVTGSIAKVMLFNY